MIRWDQQVLEDLGNGGLGCFLALVAALIVTGSLLFIGAVHEEEQRFQRGADLWNERTGDDLSWEEFRDLREVLKLEANDAD